MARITVEDCLQQVNNRFIIVHMSDYRTRQLLKGAKMDMAATDNREVVNSLREIAEGSVSLTEDTVEQLKSKGFLYEEDE
ncbi:MAG: DNA-directed RNA polymerase subunit omega [Deltaproteobacteria bacterium]|nr:DNA-directed RNA polymerase subunit omega [Deltaproteobacteria bacterium]